MRVVFVGGFGRSGSTLLERVLGELPGVCALGEVMQLWARLRRDDRCSCGAGLSGCDFWRGVGDKAFGGWHRLDIDRVLALQQAVERLRHLPAMAAPRLSSRRQALVTEYADCYHRVYEAAASMTGAPVIVDSSKRPALAYCLRHVPGPELRIVQLVRDPRGVAYSWTKQVAQPAGDGAAMMPRYHPATSACYWSAFNAAFGLLRLPVAGGRRPVPIHLLRYEDLLADPRWVVGDLAAFAGVAVRTADLSYLDDAQVELGLSHTVAGNPIRFRTGRIDLRRDDTWRTALPVRHRRLVTAICAPLLSRYGYPLVVR
jgi:hypothetical protein